ncbi:MAG: hypothetical protein H6712_10855 [Myxococcales bacterium]|nr:hypothetical protein [Myxococcales bacterium]
MHRAGWLSLVVLLGCSPTSGGFGSGDGGTPEDTTGAPGSTSEGPGPGGTGVGTAEGGTSVATTGDDTLEPGTSSAAADTSTGEGTTGDAEESSSGGPPAQSLPEHPCAEEGTLASIAADAAAQIVWHNESGAVRRLYWLDYTGTRNPFGQLEPGQTSGVYYTYATHPWLVTDAAEQCVTIFVTVPGNHDIVLY